VDAHNDHSVPFCLFHVFCECIRDFSFFWCIINLSNKHLLGQLARMYNIISVRAPKGAVAVLNKQTAIAPPVSRAGWQRERGEGGWYLIGQRRWSSRVVLHPHPSQTKPNHPHTAHWVVVLVVLRIRTHRWCLMYFVYKIDAFAISCPFCRSQARIYVFLPVAVGFFSVDGPWLSCCGLMSCTRSKATTRCHEQLWC